MINFIKVIPPPKPIKSKADLKNLIHETGVYFRSPQLLCMVWIPYMVIRHEDGRRKGIICIDAFFINKLTNPVNIVFLVRNTLLKLKSSLIKPSYGIVLPFEYEPPEDIVRKLASIRAYLEICHDKLRENLKALKLKGLTSLHAHMGFARRMREVMVAKMILDFMKLHYKSNYNAELYEYIYYPEALLLSKKCGNRPFLISLGGRVEIDRVYSWLVEKDPLFRSWVLRLLERYSSDSQTCSIK